MKVGGQARSVIGWIGINLVLTFTIGGISWQGHLGGLFGGLVLGAAMVYAPREHRSLVQWTVVGVMLALSVAAIVLRIAVLHVLSGFSTPGDNPVENYTRVVRATLLPLGGEGEADGHEADADHQVVLAEVLHHRDRASRCR